MNPFKVKEEPKGRRASKKKWSQRSSKSSSSESSSSDLMSPNKKALYQTDFDNLVKQSKITKYEAEITLPSKIAEAINKLEDAKQVDSTSVHMTDPPKISFCLKGLYPCLCQPDCQDSINLLSSHTLSNHKSHTRSSSSSPPHRRKVSDLKNIFEHNSGTPRNRSLEPNRSELTKIMNDFFELTDPSEAPVDNVESDLLDELCQEMDLLKISRCFSTSFRTAEHEPLSCYHIFQRGSVNFEKVESFLEVIETSESTVGTSKNQITDTYVKALTRGSIEDVSAPYKFSSDLEFTFPSSSVEAHTSGEENRALTRGPIEDVSAPYKFSSNLEFTFPSSSVEAHTSGEEQAKSIDVAMPKSTGHLCHLKKSPY